ncbi:hypothetical protein MXB_4413, partial [Myxobolus squamalis]
MGITRKRLVKIVERKNEAKNFAIQYRNKDRENLLYPNETGFNIHTSKAMNTATSKSYEYSHINTPARIIVPTARGKNILLLAVISTRGSLHSKIVDGAYNSILLVEFLNECLTRKVFNANTIVLMDNVQFHKTT